HTPQPAAQATSPPQSVPPPPKVRVRKASLRYELNGRRFPLPLVRGTIAGTPTWMLVDTGANSHVVAGWLARQVRLPLKKLGDLAPNGGRVCEDDASPIKGLAFVLPATIEGKQVDLLLDTGAQRSDLLLSAPAGRALTARSVANKEQLYAASGKMTSRTVKGA